jgi:hypothetical protein
MTNVRYEVVAEWHIGVIEVYQDLDRISTGPVSHVDDGSLTTSMGSGATLIL